MKTVLVLILGTLVAATPEMDGNAILARAATASGLNSYSVPVHFDVHMHRPIGVKSGAEGVAYFKSPSQAALAITKIPGPIGQFFKGSYTIDMVPQTWPNKYNVTSVSQGQAGGVATYVLQAVPKSDPSVDSTVFTVTQNDYQPVSTVWHYKDGSTINLAIANQKVSGFTLPQTETISVTMPKYALDATATYGTYSVNASVPDSVFGQH